MQMSGALGDVLLNEAAGRIPPKLRTESVAARALDTAQVISAPSVPRLRLLQGTKPCYIGRRCLLPHEGGLLDSRSSDESVEASAHAYS